MLFEVMTVAEIAFHQLTSLAIPLEVLNPKRF
jgi:hypothetical protein